MIRWSALSLAATLLACPALASAEILRWVDEKGRVHYTDRHNTPVKYRPQAQAQKSAPPPSASARPDKASIALQRRGNVAVVAALLNNTASARLVVDTGAACSVISRATARQLGIELEGRKWPTQAFQTANGVIHAPMVTLESIDIGGMEVKNLQAAVHDTFPDASVAGLLGLDYLSQFRMDIDNQSLTLHLERK
jgi:aspartyl protease family protein